MKIVNICYDDYANYMHSQTKAMQSIGMDVLALKTKGHVFGYEEQCKTATDVEMSEAIRSADLVQIFHSCKRSSSLIKAVRPGVPVTVWHTGSIYRADPKGTTAVFLQSNNVKLEFTDQCEFLMLDGKLQYVAVSVDTDRIKPRRFKTAEKYVFAHYPSKSAVKGTEDIIRMMRSFASRCIFKYSDETIPHEYQLARMGLSDIYIELFKPELNGRPYGCFGVTAFEAAALGLVVVTQNIHEPAYNKVYGGSPFIIANTEEAFISRIEWLLNANRTALQKIKADTLKWVNDKHSLKATGARIEKILRS